jgi:DNA-binding transcriptional MerR regulator
VSTATERPAAQRLHTIGAVCRRLQSEFPDISISKIRYLEDQGLLAPKRTRGGYRLFSEDDVERLETILRLQRDEFLPLRVIRQELETAQPSSQRRRRRPSALAAEEEALTLGELCERAGVTAQVARELEEFGLLSPRVESGDRVYPEADAEIAALCARLRKDGIPTAHLKRFRMDADNEAAILGQVVTPKLRSRKPEQREEGAEQLQELARLAQELSQLLFWRSVRRAAAT